MSSFLKIVMVFKPIFNNHILRLLTGVPLTLCALQSAEYCSEHDFLFFNKLFFTLGVFIFYYLVYLSIINQMFVRIYSFHENLNSEKLSKNPLKFAFKHRNKIFVLYKSFGVLFMFVSFYVIWIIN